MKISIIIPVYNCATYLRESVDSCLSEKEVYDIEVLLIDDGSTDGSEKICDECASLYPQVRVIHTENRGVSCARNTGIEESTGDWIMFVDADDVLEHNTLSMLDKEANFQQYEMTRFSRYRLVNGRKYPDPLNVYGKDVVDHLDHVVRRDATKVVCGGIYAKSLFGDNGVRFNSDIRLGEDWIMLFKLLCHTQTFNFLDVQLYGYRTNPESVTQKKMNYVRPDVLKAYNVILEYAKEHGVQLKEESLMIAKSEIRRDYKKKAVYSNSRKFYVDVHNAMRCYMPQSIWDDIRYSTKPKHVLVFLAYAFLSPCYRLFAKATKE